ncbi:MAG TPA: MarR family winged helix-turn-helix transcriptional regulator [Pseudaminobacter sp.]|jgi:DNA-binding MarR family transcriptional regulator|nr:MarR family winged helix-turn-helix transcriptional regulator [Pseudaminobacter sp.]
MDRDKAGAQIFGFFNEIGIVSQLSSALFMRLIPGGLHLSHFIVLNHLVRVGDCRTPMQIAAALQVTKATMTHTLGVLGRHGFVEVGPNPNDGRSKLVRLTPAGRSFRDEAIASLAPAFGFVAEALTPAEIQAALPVLEKVRKLLDAERDSPTIG